MPAGRACARSSFDGSRMPFAVRAEAAEGDAEGVAQVIGGGLGIVLGFVRRERSAFGAIDGGLGPSLGRDARATGRDIGTRRRSLGAIRAQLKRDLNDSRKIV